ncbi:class I SAM-dependent methyltransferase [Roseibium sp.]|uniref:class I SAM-dependent methyltransferase n=1 Tax=Roseibium sp. TaxID=1936156 RepID=UPI003A984C3E
MSHKARKTHWQNAWAEKNSTNVSWYEETPSVSLDLINRHTGCEEPSIVDIGGGASFLIDRLMERRHGHMAVLDISGAALEVSKTRLGDKAEAVEWIVSDVLDWDPSMTFDVWHDRAAFHFLTAPEDQARYAAVVHKALKPGGLLVIGTFAIGGPEKCSGLAVRQHDAHSLAEVFGPGFALLETRDHLHPTPFGTIQKFSFSAFHRSAER